VEGYKIQIKPSAVKELEALPNKELSRVVRRIQGLADNPRPPGCEKLSREEKYRIRQGSYRVVYAISDDERTVLVVKVGHRREVYR
jgi:mRNA interferase RelE/StbE